MDQHDRRSVLLERQRREEVPSLEHHDRRVDDVGLDERTAQDPTRG